MHVTYTSQLFSEFNAYLSWVPDVFSWSTLVAWWPKATICWLEADQRSANRRNKRHLLARTRIASGTQGNAYHNFFSILYLKKKTCKSIAGALTRAVSAYVGFLFFFIVIIDMKHDKFQKINRHACTCMHHIRGIFNSRRLLSFLHSNKKNLIHKLWCKY